MDLGDIIIAILDFFGDFITLFDVEWLRFWRFFFCMLTALALAGSLDFLTAHRVPVRFLYFPVSLLGALIGFYWEVSVRKR